MNLLCIISSDTLGLLFFVRTPSLCRLINLVAMINLFFAFLQDTCFLLCDCCYVKLRQRTEFEKKGEQANAKNCLHLKYQLEYKRPTLIVLFTCRHAEIGFNSSQRTAICIDALLQDCCVLLRQEAVRHFSESHNNNY